MAVPSPNPNPNPAQLRPPTDSPWHAPSLSLSPSHSPPTSTPQVITNEVNQAVTDLLLRMKMLQDRAIARNPAKGNSSRWYVCGLREVRKHIKLGKARMVVLAPNIEQVRGRCWAGPGVASCLPACVLLCCLVLHDWAAVLLAQPCCGCACTVLR